MTETLFSSVHLILSFSLSTINHFNFFCIGFSRRDDGRNSGFPKERYSDFDKIGNVLNIDRWFVSGGF